MALSKAMRRAFTESLIEKILEIDWRDFRDLDSDELLEKLEEKIEEAIDEALESDSEEDED